jgi:hypothetical protein
VDSPGTPCPGEAYLSTLSTANRTVLSEAREKYFTSPVNRASLAAIDNALHIAFLTEDDDSYFDPVCEAGMFAFMLTSYRMTRQNSSANIENSSVPTVIWPGVTILRQYR